MTEMIKFPGGRRMAERKTDSEEGFIDLTMSFDPMRELAPIDEYALVTAVDAGLALGDGEDIPDLYGFLARPHFEPSAPEHMEALDGMESDPFNAGVHFRQRPFRSASGDFAFSLVLAIREEEAHRILSARSPAKLGPIVKTFEADRRGGKFYTIGYASLAGSFKGHRLAIEEIGEEVTEDDLDPRRYILFLKPEAFFLSVPFRGQGLGRLAGALLAQPVLNELRWLNHRGLCFAQETLVEINTYYEIYSEGGEAAVTLFHEELEVMEDYLAEGAYGTGEGGVEITKIIKDGGW